MPSGTQAETRCHSLQWLADSWLSSFTRQCHWPDFSLAKYLEEAAAKELAGAA